jgi:uncharacterized protein (TIGR02001 family)
MKKTALALAALALTSGSALAADLLNKKAPAAPVVVSPWDFTVGGGATSNYIFRGISQSNNGPSGNVNAELRYTVNPTWQLYLGSAASSIKLTNQATSPSVEIDAIGGVRATIGNVTVDVGGIYYIYPYNVNEAGNNGFWITNPSWYEGYTKISYAVTDALTFGVNAFYTPSYLDFGSNGTYLSATAKYTVGDFALSGEFGRQWLGKCDAQHITATCTGSRTIGMPDYNYWNAGASYSYKFATLDLRYHSTDMSKRECSYITGTTLTGGGAGVSKYCGTAVVGTLSFALTGKDLK